MRTFWCPFFFFFFPCSAAGSPTARYLSARNESRNEPLLDDVEAALGLPWRLEAEARASHLEQKLLPLFAVLPRSSGGDPLLLGAGAARVVLRRHFARKGWHVHVLESTWGSSTEHRLSPTAFRALGSLLSRLQGPSGLCLAELAALAAAIEVLVLYEGRLRLEATYTALGFSVQSLLSERDANKVLDTLLAASLSEVHDVSLLDAPQLRALCEAASSNLPSWRKAQNFARDLLSSLGPDLSRRFSFADMAGVVGNMSERYGLHQDSDCQAIRDQLLELESSRETNGTGRVRLQDFYLSYLTDGNWQFDERIEYLIQAGAVDKTDTSVPRIIIPNYMNLFSMCQESGSSLHAHCCINRCDSLLQHLESQIQAPYAIAEDILRIVAPAPAGVAEGVREKLEEVASYHGGQVPLHGRLFAQWMHFAFPRDCPYPHVSGSVRDLTASEWTAVTGTDLHLAPSELETYLEALLGGGASSSSEASLGKKRSLPWAMWRPEEELFDTSAWSGPSWSYLTLRIAALLAVVVTSAGAMSNHVRQACGSASDWRLPKSGERRRETDAHEQEKRGDGG